MITAFKFVTFSGKLTHIIATLGLLPPSCYLCVPPRHEAPQEAPTDDSLQQHVMACVNALEAEREGYNLLKLPEAQRLAMRMPADMASHLFSRKCCHRHVHV
jgi:hypothetical protein